MNLLTEYWLEEKSREDIWEPIGKALGHRQLLTLYRQEKAQRPDAALRGIRVSWEVLDLPQE